MTIAPLALPLPSNSQSEDEDVPFFLESVPIRFIIDSFDLIAVVVIVSKVVFVVLAIGPAVLYLSISFMSLCTQTSMGEQHVFVLGLQVRRKVIFQLDVLL